MQPPDEQTGIDLTQVKIRAQGVDEPVFYEMYPDASGKARLEVSPGRYTMLLSALYPEGFSVSASYPEFLALPMETTDFTFTLDPAPFRRNHLQADLLCREQDL